MWFSTWPKALYLSPKLQKCNPLHTQSDLWLNLTLVLCPCINVIQSSVQLTRFRTYLFRWVITWSSFIFIFSKMEFFSLSFPPFFLSPAVLEEDFKWFKLEFTTHAHRTLFKSKSSVLPWHYSIWIKSEFKVQLQTQPLHPSLISLDCYSLAARD